jgi:SAM-dependent methyltransferase
MELAGVGIWSSNCATAFLPNQLMLQRYWTNRVSFVQADVTQLSRTGIGTNFELIVDNGCLHNMSDDDRDAYVREISAVAAPQARLLIVAFVPGGRIGVRGVSRAEMERRFASIWTLVSAGPERELDRAEKTPAWYYLFQRRDA